MIAALVAVALGIGFLLLVASLAVASWQDRRIRQGKRADDRPRAYPEYPEPFVPGSWRPTDDHLRDTTPHPPAS